MQACREFAKVQELRPEDAEAPVMLARVRHSLNQRDAAIEVMETFLKQHPLSSDATHINILAELYMEGKQYHKASQLIQRAAEHVCPSGLPIDLQVAPIAVVPKDLRGCVFLAVRFLYGDADAVCCLASGFQLLWKQHVILHIVKDLIPSPPPCLSSGPRGTP